MINLLQHVRDMSESHVQLRPEKNAIRCTAYTEYMSAWHCEWVLIDGNDALVE